MREYLFRGKLADQDEWIEGSLILYGEDAVIFAVRDFPEGTGTFSVDPNTVGQYTGLKDKNGKRIFEGDVVRHHNDNPYAIPSIIEKGEVYWCERGCGWRRTSNGAFHHGVVDTYRMSPECVYEVIGNIHDSPELLGR